MRLPSRLRLSRHGIWYFRFVLPDSLAVLLGQKEIRRTLGTRCPKVAQHTAYRLSGRILPFIEVAKHAMTFDPNNIDPNSIRELLAKGLRINVKAGTIEADHFETSPDPAIAKREMESLESLTRAMREHSPETKALLAEEDAKLAAYVNSLANKAKCSNPTTIEESIKAFMKHKKGLAAGSKRTYEFRLARLASLMGGPQRMLHEVSAIECVNALETHQDAVPHDSKRKEGASSDKGTLSASTIKDTLALWQSFFSWAIKTGRYVGGNPITDLPRPSAGNNDGSGAEPFTREELATIFQWRHFAAFKRPHQFWGPLIGLLMGMRSNEIAQLRIKDIVKQDGITCFRVIHDPKGDSATVLKNNASNRTLPIHPTLWQIGLQAYLDDLRSLGANRLFPNLPADPETMKREKYLSRDFNENYLRDTLHIWVTRRKVFHSFRDNVSSLLGRKKLNPNYKDDWLGHARQGVDPEHYDQSLSIQEQIDMVLPLLDFGIDFSEFAYQPGRWNEWLSGNMVP